MKLPEDKKPLIEEPLLHQISEDKGSQNKSLTSKILASSVATVAAGGLAWIIGKSPKISAVAGAVAFAASFALNK